METNDTPNKKRTGIITSIFQAFNGLSALAGGFGLMSDPSGQALAMKTTWLQGTPFSSFLIPGIVLFIVNGLGNSVGFIITIKKNKYAGHVATLFGGIMMVWIISQVAWIGYMSFLQPLYFSTGLLQLVFGYRMIQEQKKNSEISAL